MSNCNILQKRQRGEKVRNERKEVIMEQFIFGKVRVQILSDGVVRLECARKGKFCDKNTFLISERQKFSGAASKARVYGSSVVFGDYVINVASESGLSGLTVTKNGSAVYKYKKMQSSGDLPAVDKTPEIFAFADNPRAFVPEGGYSYRGKLKNSGFSFEENTVDIYLLFCGGNAEKLRSLYISLTGRGGLIPLSALGLGAVVNCGLDEKTVKSVAEGFKAAELPLDVLAIGESENTSENISAPRFQEAPKLFSYARINKLKTMYCGGLKPVEGASNVFHPAEVKFREKKLNSLLKQGLDYWQCNNSQATVPPVSGLSREMLAAYVSEEISRRRFENAASGEDVSRPLAISTVSEDVGAGAHRFPVVCAGELLSAEDISSAVENMLKLADSGLYAYYRCGIYNGCDGDYIRRAQYSALSPAMFLNCNVGGQDYIPFTGETEQCVREYVNLRRRLLPVIYKNVYENYNCGKPAFRALGWEYPQDKRACKRRDEYLLGNDILIAPVSEAKSCEREVYLPKGRWIDVFDGKIYSGGKTVVKEYCVGEAPVFVRLGALLPLAYAADNAENTLWDNLVFDFYPAKEFENNGYVYEDDGATCAYLREKCRKSAYSARYDANSNAFKIIINAAEGSFEGDKAAMQRRLTVKYHLLSGVNSIKRVTVNGADTDYVKTAKNKTVFPLNTEKNSPDGGCALVEFAASVDKLYEIVFYLN